MVRRRRVTIGWLMATIAVWALVLATLRFEFGIFIYAGPLAGFLWDVRRGGRGFTGGLVGGVIALWVTGLIILAIIWYRGNPGSLKAMLAGTNFLILTGVGATFCIVVGAVVWLLTKVPKVIWYVLNIPKGLRLRFKRGEAANLFRQGPSDCSSFTNLASTLASEQTTIPGLIDASCDGARTRNSELEMSAHKLRRAMPMRSPPLPVYASATDSWGGDRRSDAVWPIG